MRRNDKAGIYKTPTRDAPLGPLDGPLVVFLPSILNASKQSVTGKQN